jgi:RNA polymerase sigma-70 factor, ECF subfamily
MLHPRPDPPPASGAAGFQDEEIVQRVVAGDVALFELLLRRHNARVYRTVRAVLGRAWRDEAEIEDVMQQVYVAAYSHLGQFRGDARFSTWLVSIAVNEALGRTRRRLRVVPVGDVSEAEEGVASMSSTPPADPERGAADHELGRLLEEAVADLPEHYRTVFVLRDVEGMSGGEAAEALAISEDLVKQRLHRARALLRKAIHVRVGTAARNAFHFDAVRCDRVVSGVMARLAGLTAS